MNGAVFRYYIQLIQFWNRFVFCDMGPLRTCLVFLLKSYQLGDISFVLTELNWNQYGVDRNQPAHWVLQATSGLSSRRIDLQ